MDREPLGTGKSRRGSARPLEISEWVTGKFVLEVWENADHDRMLRVTVELVPDAANTPERTRRVAASIRDELLGRNAEYAYYVSPERQLPHVELRPTGDPDYFPVGVEHRYTPLISSLYSSVRNWARL